MAARVQGAAAAFLALAVSLHPVVAPDLWWHLSAGRRILADRTVPRTDFLTFTREDSPWIDLQWLTDVLLAGLWSWAGPDGVVLFKALAFAGVAGLVVAAARAAGAGAGAAGAAASLAVLTSAERTLARPEIFTYVALSATLLAIHRVRRGKRRSAISLPVITVLWVNLHALAFLGPATTLMYAVLTRLERGPPRPLPDAPGTGGERAARDLGLAGAVSALALLLNPYGLAAWTFPFTLWQRIDRGHEAFSRILEFVSPLETPGDPFLRIPAIFLALFALSFVGRRRSALLRLLPVLPFLALALLARRNIPLFAWVAAPVLAVNLSEGIGRARALRRLSLAPVGVAILVALAVLAGSSPWLLGLHRDRGLGVTPGLFPETCLAALDRSGAAGPLFHDLDFGGYVTWRDPTRKAFIDGRLEVAGPEWFGRFLEAHEDPAAWRRMRSSWNLEVLLLEHSAKGSAAFLRALLRSGNWETACLSPEAALLLWRGADGEEPAIPRAEIRIDSSHRPGSDAWTAILAEDRGPAPHAGDALVSLTGPLHRRLAPRPTGAAVRRAVRYANLCLTLGWIPEAREGYRAVLSVAPRDVEAHVNLGLCDVREGNPGKARDYWKGAIPKVSRGDRARLREAIARLNGKGD
jgi:hypothetical protein